MTLKKVYASILTVLVLTALFPPFFVEAFELKLYDLLSRYTSPERVDRRFVIVGIDQKSLDQYGLWPWPRDVMGKLVEKLAGFGVKVTALDVTFTSKTDVASDETFEEIKGLMQEEGIDSKYPDFFSRVSDLYSEGSKDKDLALGIEKASNVITGFIFHGKDEAEYSAEVDKLKLPIIQPHRIKLVARAEGSEDATIWFKVNGVDPNIPVIQSAGRGTGFLNAVPDPDGVIRSHPMVIEYKGDFYPSLSLSTVALYLDSYEEMTVVFDQGVLAGVAIGEKRFLPLDVHGHLMPRFMGGDGTFPHVSAADVLSEPLSNEILKDKLDGKIVFIGGTATQLYDLRVSPLGFTTGVEIMVNVAASALTGNIVTKFGWQKLYDALLTVVIGLILLVAIRRLKIYMGLAFAVSLVCATLWFNYWMFKSSGVWLNSFSPVMMGAIGFVTITVFEYVGEQKSRRFIKDAFSRYLSPDVIHQLIEKPELLKLGGEKKVMTAFFSDVAGFTSISEGLQPTELVALLNDYLSEMTDIILERNGTVDKYEGDAIIAFWGAPLSVPDHALQCVASAVAMQEKLSVLRKKWKAEGKPELYVRMGMNTGEMVVGNMGSKNRMDYTMMGDSVNLAARLEGVNKYYGTSLMVSEFTHKIVKDDFLTRLVDKVRVEGKKDSIKIYEVICEKTKATEKQIEMVEEFAEALRTFRNFEMDRAEKLFMEFGKKDWDISQNIISNLYLSRIVRLRKSKPSEEWDFVYDLAK